MTKTFRKNILRTVSGSIGRYLSILLIVMLGVGFFSGLRLTKRCMLAVEEEYLRTYQLCDLRLISTIGFDEQDVEAACDADGTTVAEGSVWADFITVQNGAETVLRAHMLTSRLNLPVLIEGRMPEKGNEILIDADRFASSCIGQTICLKEYNTEETLESFRYGEYTVVGRARSPLYLNRLGGTSSLGSGSLDGFVLMPEDGFVFEYYTELYLKTSDDYAPYSDAYNSQMEDFSVRAENSVLRTILERFDSLVSDAEDEIADAESTLASETADAEKELADAEQELNDAKKKLDKADKQLQSSLYTLNSNEKKLNDASGTLAESKKKLDAGAEQMAPGAGSWDEAIAVSRQQINDNQLLLDSSINAAREQLDASKAKLDSNEEAYSVAVSQFEIKWDEYNSSYEIWSASFAEISAQRNQYNTRLEAYNSANASYQAARSQFEADRDQLSPEEVSATEAQLSAESTRLSKELADLQSEDSRLTGEETLSANTKLQLDASKVKIDAEQAALDNTRAGLDAGWDEYYIGVNALEANRAEQQAKLDAASAKTDEFEAGVASYRKGVAELESGKTQLESGRRKWYAGKAEYDSGLKEYNDGLAEYEDGVKELNDKVAEAEEEIRSAKEELADLEDPELFVLERSESNSGYSTFNSDSDIVANVAKVFPVFFFMVAALICSTTMTRMVDDDRTQIGALRAIGYSKGQIYAKYLIYSGSAALIGSVAGFFAGGYLFPLVIWTAYQMLYCIDGYICIYQWSVLAVTVAAALICSTGTTCLALRRQLSGTPADLIRPSSPAAGKRVLLERVSFIWNRLSFMHKITVRNIFRFKKRMFMMLLGIAGCTALLLTGFGIYDSVADIAEYQYDNIQVYDINVTASSSADEELISDISSENGSQLETVTKVLMNSADVTASGIKKSAYLVATDDDSVGEVIRFFLGSESVPFPEKGNVLLSKKMASQLGVSVGDTVTLSVSDTDRGQVTVSGIVENHVFNYVYMTGETFTQTFSKPYEPKNLLLRLKDSADVYRVSARISSLDGVAAVSVVQDTRNMVINMMASLDYVVALVCASAAALAFIVMFNLGNINISERVREIATIKVLGFHAGETGAYVFRENLVLTIIGIVLGLPLGVLMHSFVMSQINVDVVSFITRIKWQSYIITSVMVLIFALFTDLVLRRKINRIHMAESLKSIE